MIEGTAAARRRMQARWMRWMLACLLALPVLAQAQSASPATPSGGDAKTVLVMGDSLSAGYGMSAGEGWVSLLQQRLQRDAPGWRVVNASISGETSAGGASRIAETVVREQPDIVIIALGANDGLRGLPVPAAEANLRAMVTMAQTARARVVLVGMRMPPNYGRAYTDSFFAMYKRVAGDMKTALVPFMLEGVAEKPDWFQADRLHPAAQAHPTILANIWPTFSALIKQR